MSHQAASRMELEAITSCWPGGRDLTRTRFFGGLAALATMLVIVFASPSGARGAADDHGALTDPIVARDAAAAAGGGGGAAAGAVGAWREPPPPSGVWGVAAGAGAAAAATAGVAWSPPPPLEGRNGSSSDGGGGQWRRRELELILLHVPRSGG